MSEKIIPWEELGMEEQEKYIQRAYFLLERGYLHAPSDQEDTNVAETLAKMCYIKSQTKKD